MKEGAGGERRGIEREGGGGEEREGGGGGKRKCDNTCLQYETYICS